MEEKMCVLYFVFCLCVDLSVGSGSLCFGSFHHRRIDRLEAHSGFRVGGSKAKYTTQISINVNFTKKNRRRLTGTLSRSG